MANVSAKIDPRGLKRICTNCGTRFYDMNKRPIVCPSCSSEFSIDVKVKSRRTRADAANEAAESQAETAATENADEDKTEIKPDENVVSLEDAAGEENNDDDDETQVAGDLDLDKDLSELENIDDIDDDLDDDDLDNDIDLKPALNDDRD